MPYTNVARFSNVSGQSLPTGDPANLYGWNNGGLQNPGGTSLVLNDGTLYLGGGSGEGPFNSLLYLPDPQAADPSDWGNLSTNDLNSVDVSDVFFMGAATNGNAVYVYGDISGEDSFGNSSGFPRLVTGPDYIPWAYITNGVWTTNAFSFTIVGEPGSVWQVVASTDMTNWTDISGTITLWGGTNVFSYTNDTGQPYFWLTNYYSLTNYCVQAPVFAFTNGLPTLPTNGVPPFSFTNVVDVQFGNAGDPQQTGIAVTGVTPYDFWNVVPAETNFNEYGFPIYISGGVFGGYAVSDTPLLDENGVLSGINLLVLTGSYEGGDPPYTQLYGDDPNPLIEEQLIPGSGDNLYLGLSLPTGHTYDVYVYSVTPYVSGIGGRYPATFTITNYSGPYDVSISDWPAQTPSAADYATDTWTEGNQCVVFTNLVGGAWTFSAFSEWQTVVNGLQIVVHGD